MNQSSTPPVASPSPTVAPTPAASSPRSHTDPDKRSKSNDPLGPHSPRVARISDELRRLVRAQTTAGGLVNAILDHSVARPEIYGVGTLVSDSDGFALTAHRVKQPCWRTPLEMDQTVGACIKAVASGTMQVVEIPGVRDCSAIVVPSCFGESAALVLLVAGTIDSPLVAGEAILAELLGVHLSAWQDRQRASELSQRLSSTAATLELVRRIESAGSLPAASLEIVSSLQEHLRCEQVVIGLCHSPQTCRVTAISGVAEVNENAVLTRRLKAVLDETLTRQELSAWPPPPNASAHQLLAHKQLVRRDESVLSVPLKSGRGRQIGALAIRGPRELASLSEVRNFVATLDDPLGSALDAVRRIQGGRVRRLIHRLAPSAGKRRAAWAAAGLAAAASLAVPIEYRVGCQSVVEPVERRFCVAPHEGLLQSTLAEPGDMVQAGQQLARMDGREVRLELSEISSKLHRAAKQRDTHQARHEVAEAVMAELEMQRLETRAQLLRLRQEALDVASPIQGIVLAGSIGRRENLPVTKGQVLYEIAPLDPLRVEAGVPASEITHVGEGMRALVAFEGLGGERVEGTVRAIRPRSEIRDEQNVFVAEIEIDNPAGRIRPGMQGKARIVAQPRAIGWVLFHRAWEKLLTAWPW